MFNPIHHAAFIVCICTRYTYSVFRPFVPMPCPFTGCKMFSAGPNFLSQPKNWTAFSASSKTFGPAQKPILLNAIHLFVWYILRSVKGQGM